MDGYTHYGEYTRGRQAVFKLLDENPLLSFAALRQKLRKANITLKNQTIRNYMSQWRLYSRKGAVPRFHFGLGQLKSTFDACLWEAAPFYGWKVSRNKNRERLWFESNITLGWHRNGTVVFRFRGFKPQGHLLGVFSHAFWRVLLSTWKTEREAADCLQALFKERYRQITRHSTYETGQPLPRTIIRDRENSHGEIIKLGDGSDPTRVEIEEREPFWLSKLDETMDLHVRHLEERVDSLAAEMHKLVSVLRELTQPTGLQDSRSKNLSYVA